MTSINSEEPLTIRMPSAPSGEYVSIDIHEDNESKEIINTGDWMIGVTGCVGVLIILAGATIGLLYLGKLL
jgi:hypothetical protein